VVLVQLDPTVGSEIRKTRPCVVVSPDELNRAVRTAIVAPMTTSGHSYPWRVPVVFGGKRGHIVLDQLRTIDRARIVRRLGTLDPSTAHDTLQVLAQLFAP
jgi:mRNA interferase MazF